MSMLKRLLVFTVVLSLGFTATAGAQKSSCEFTGVERIVAVGDVHGAYDSLVQMLQTAGIVDAKLKWAGGKTHFVQLGDVLDRGSDSRKVLDLYRRLEKEANSAGGRVHFLLGNHEAMRMTGDRRYVSPDEYKAFANSGSQSLLSNFVEAVADPAAKEEIKAWPLGALELIRAFGSKETYGQYLLSLNAVIRINDTVFAHAGISPAVSSMSCETINDTIRQELTTDLAKTQAAPTTTLSMGTDGPLWYRALAMEPEEALAPELDKILAAQQARRMVIAHTPQETGRITARFGGKVIAIDTGMQTGYVPTGRASALEIIGDKLTAVYADGRQPVTGQ